MSSKQQVSSGVWILKVHDDQDGNLIKTINLKLPKDIKIGYVEIEEKVDSKSSTSSVDNKSDEIVVGKEKTTKNNVSSVVGSETHQRQPYYVPGMQFHGPIHPMFFQYPRPLYPPYSVHTPPHQLNSPMVQPSPNSPPHFFKFSDEYKALTEDQIISSEEVKEKNNETSSTSISSISKEILSSMVSAEKTQNIEITPFKDDIEEETKDVQKIEKKQSKKKKKNNNNNKKTYANVAAAAADVPPPKPSKPIKPKPVVKTDVVASSSTPSKKLKPNLTEVFNAVEQKFDLAQEKYSSVLAHPDFTLLVKRNLFGFSIPKRFNSSVLAQRFPQSYKYKLLSRKVGIYEMNQIQNQWARKPKGNSFKADYPGDTCFYFTVFYHFKGIDVTSVDPSEEKPINICHVFNRFYVNDHQCACKFQEDCTFYHICMICGSTKHSAFERVSAEDRSYVCPEHAKLVEERAEFKGEGILDNDFTRDIEYFEDIHPDESDSDESQTDSMKEDILFNNDKVKNVNLLDDHSFPPLPASPIPTSQKKLPKTKKQKSVLTKSEPAVSESSQPIEQSA